MNEPWAVRLPSSATIRRNDGVHPRFERWNRELRLAAKDLNCEEKLSSRWMIGRDVVAAATQSADRFDAVKRQDDRLGEGRIVRGAVWITGD